ncbi:MAG: RNA methyltransferase, partial [Negativicutes bacterium]|nr:RNA methyltransferase [Negativicutes bacterium]
MVNFYIGLIHYPVYNRRGEIITTAVTNFDLHDIARTAVTYGAAGYYIVHDQPGQREIIGEILAYWQEGAGSRHNPDRNQALSVVRLAENLDEVCRAIERENGGLSPFVVATAARLAEGDRRLDTEQLRCLARTG